MTRKVFCKLLCLAVLPLLVSACSTTPTTRGKAETLAPARDLIAEVRAAAEDLDDGLEVQPLPDPLTEDLRERAAWHEAAGEFGKADEVLLQALELTPGDPLLLQWRAEMALALGRYKDAMQLANTSWQAGPRTGSLCRRNWATIQVVSELTDSVENAEAASVYLARCTVEPPVRM